MASVAEGNLITSPQTITGDWEDVKDVGTSGETETDGYSFFGAYIEFEINDSRDVEFRYRALKISGGTEHYIPLKIIRNTRIDIKDVPERLDSDTDQSFVLEAVTDSIVPIIKLQVRALTVGAIPGIITTATYRQGYRQ